VSLVFRNHESGVYRLRGDDRLGVRPDPLENLNRQRMDRIAPANKCWLHQEMQPNIRPVCISLRVEGSIRLRSLAQPPSSPLRVPRKSTSALSNGSGPISGEAKPKNFPRVPRADSINRAIVDQSLLSDSADGRSCSRPPPKNLTASHGRRPPEDAA